MLSIADPFKKSLLMWWNNIFLINQYGCIVPPPFYYYLPSIIPTVYQDILYWPSHPSSFLPCSLNSFPFLLFYPRAACRQGLHLHSRVPAVENSANTSRDNKSFKSMSHRLCKHAVSSILHGDNLNEFQMRTSTTFALPAQKLYFE